MCTNNLPHITDIDLNPFDDPGGPVEIDLGIDDVDFLDIDIAGTIEHEVYYIGKAFKSIDLNPFDANEALELDLIESGEIIIEEIEKDPFGTIGTVALVLLNAPAWVFALNSGASAAYQGEDAEGIVGAMLKTYVGAQLGDVVANQTGNILQNAGVPESIVSLVEKGSEQFATTLVHTEGDLEAASNAFLTGSLTEGMGMVLGKIDDQLGNILTEVDGATKQWTDLGAGIRDGVTAGLTAAIEGGDISEAALNNLVSTYTKGVIAPIVDVSEELGIDLDDNRVRMLAQSLGASVNAAVSGGMEPTDAFFASLNAQVDEQIKDYINSAEGLGANQLFDSFFGTQGVVEEKLNALTTAQSNMTTAANSYNAILTEEERLYKRYSDAVDLYNSTEGAQGTNYAALGQAYQNYVNANASAKQDYLNTYNAIAPTIEGLQEEFNTASENLLSDLDEFPEMFEKYKRVTNEVVGTATMMENLGDRYGRFTEEDYRLMHNLGEDEDIYEHYLANQDVNATIDPNNITMTLLPDDYIYDEATKSYYRNTPSGWQRVDPFADGVSTSITYDAVSLDQFVKDKLGEDYSYYNGMYLKNTPDGYQQVNPFAESPVGNSYDITMKDIRSDLAPVGVGSRVTADISNVLGRGEDTIITLRDYHILKDAGYNIIPTYDPVLQKSFDGTDNYGTEVEQWLNDQDPSKLSLEAAYALYKNLIDTGKGIALYGSNSVTIPNIGAGPTYTTSKIETKINPEIQKIIQGALGISDQEAAERFPIGDVLNINPVTGATSQTINQGEDLLAVRNAFEEAGYVVAMDPLTERINKLEYELADPSAIVDFVQNTAGLAATSVGSLAQTFAYGKILTNAAGWTEGEVSDSVLYKLGEAIEDFGTGMQTDDYVANKEALAEAMGKNLADAEGFRESVLAVLATAADSPGTFIAEYVVSEIIQELPFLLASGGTSLLLKKGLQTAGEEFSKKIALRGALGTAAAGNVLEAYGGAAGDAYDKSYATYKEVALRNLPSGTPANEMERYEAKIEDAAIKYATENAQAAGIVGATMGLISMGIGGSALEKAIFGDKKAPDGWADAMQNLYDKSGLKDFVVEPTKVGLKEGFSEALEEGVISDFIEGRLSLIDDTRDRSGNNTAAALLGFIAGGGTGTAIAIGDQIFTSVKDFGTNADIINNSSPTNQTITNAQPVELSQTKEFMDVNNPQGGGLYSEEDLESLAGLNGNYLLMKDGYVISTDTGAVEYLLDTYGYTLDDVQHAGDLAKIKIQGEYGDLPPTLPSSIQNSKDAQSSYDALVDLGVGPDAALNVTNSLYDKNVVTQSEIENEFKTYDIEFSAPIIGEAKKILSGLNVDSDVATLVASYVDPYYLDTQEVINTAAAEGVTLTEEQAAQYVREVENDEDAAAEIAAEYDPQATTREEVEQFFAELDYTPTEEEITARIGATPEADQKEAIAAYVNPRQVTEAEARKFFEDQGYTPTDEEVAAYVGQGEEDFEGATKTTVGSYVDPRQTTEAEVRSAFEAAGFTPTDEEVAQFVGQLDQAAQETAVRQFVDPRQTTEAEVRSAFAALGFTPTDEQVAQFVGQLDQAAQETAVGQFVDPRQVTDEEARQFFANLGYEATDEEIAEFVAQVPETEQAAAIASYVDPRQVTLAEVQAIAAEEGLTLTDALAATYVGQGVAANYQTEKLSAARAEYDPLATTLEEATEFFANTGYSATPEEIAQFVASKTEETQTSAIGAYVDPRQVTAVEAEEFLSAIGYQPSQSDIEQFTGQLNDENYQVAQKAAINEYVDPRFFSASEARAAYEELGLVDVAQEDVDRFVGQFDPESEDYDPAGFEAFQRAKLESYLPTATYNLMSKTIGSPSVADDPNTPEDESKEATGIYKAIEEGSAKDAALQEAIDALSTNLGLTEAEVLKQLGTTKEDLEKAIGDVETSLGEDIGDLADVIGTPAVEDDPDTLDVDETQDPTGIFADIADLVASGSTRDEAIQTIADNLGTTKTALETAIANIDVTEQITSVIGTELGTPATDDAEATGIFADIADLVASGSTRDDAIQAVADNLGTTKTDLEKAIGAVETSLGEDISGLAGILGTPEVLDDPNTLDVDESQDPTGLFATIKQYENAGVERDEALSLAIGDVSTALGTTETNLLNTIGTTKDDLLAIIGGPATDDTAATGIYASIDEGLGALSNEIANIIGKPAQNVTQVDIDFVADTIAQDQVLSELQIQQYDVTGDGIVNDADLNLLQQAFAGQDVQLADTSMFTPATGLYGTIDTQQQTIQDLQSQIDAQTALNTELNTNLNTQLNTLINTQQAQQEAAKRQQQQQGLMQLAAAARGVKVTPPDPFQLKYMYDIGGESIFATPTQESLFVSPYDTRRQATGFLSGGMVEDETDALLRILGG